MVAVGMLPLWSYLGYVAYSLPSNLDLYEENPDKPKQSILLQFVRNASVGVAAGFFLFGIFPVFLFGIFSAFFGVFFVSDFFRYFFGFISGIFSRFFSGFFSACYRFRDLFFKKK
jgi:hypothetical protein